MADNEQVTLDLGRLLRLRGMAQSSVRDIEVDWTAADGLTETYGRLRSEVAEFVKETPAGEEFDTAFPELESFTVSRPSPLMIAKGKAAAQHAATLLEQLAGWLDGFIQEQTLEQRMRLEAEERVKQERKQPPGFAGT